MELSETVVYRDDRYWLGHPDIALYNDCLYVACRKSSRHLEQELSSIVVLKSVDRKNFELVFEIQSNFKIHSSSSKIYNCPRLSTIDEMLILTVDEVEVDSSGLIACENLTHKTQNRMFVLGDQNKIYSNPFQIKINHPIRGILPSRIVKFDSQYFMTTHTKSINDVALPTNDTDSFTSQYKKEQLSGNLYQIIWRTNQVCYSVFDYSTIIGFTGEWEQVAEIHKDDLNLCEGSLFVNNGKLSCLMRENSDLGLPAYLSESQDGESWTEPSPTRLFGCHRPCADIIKDKLFVTYREQSHLMTKEGWAKNTFSCMLDIEDGEVNYNKGIITPLDHDNSVHSDSGYTGWVHDSNLDVTYVVNYIKNDAPKPHIVMYSLAKRN